MKRKLFIFILLFTSSLVFSQTVDAGDYPGVCPGESVLLTGTIVNMPNDATESCAKWILPDGTTVSGFTANVSPTMTSVYVFEVAFNNGDIATDVVIITLCSIGIHPVDADFSMGNEGKVIIWTDPIDMTYGTINNTTKANMPAQSIDALVRVTVHITPANGNTNKTVYFRLVDPDLDDASSYELGTATGDNRDMAMGSGTLDGSPAPNVVSDMTTLAMIGGNQVAAAEVQLAITDQYSGDNYQVQASLDPTFADPTQIMETSVLVAWNRVYVENDRMYSQGATITANVVPDADAMDDIIQVDTTADFSVGDMVELFDNAGGVEAHTVIAKTPFTLTVGDVNASFNRFSGVRIVGQGATYDVPTHLFEDAYGNNVSGSDGGAFVEFIWEHDGSDTIPKYTSFPLDLDVTSFAFCTHWFKHSGNGNNIFQLVAAAGHKDNSLGTAEDPDNICFVTIDNHGTVNVADQISDTGAHEFGHLFGVSNTHVDSALAVDHHLMPPTDRCIMSYSTNDTDGITEFDLNCLYDVRDCTIPR